MNPVYNCKYAFSEYIGLEAFSFIAILVLAELTYQFYRHYRSIWTSIGLPLVAGGGFLNIYERLSTSHGCVLDYFDFLGLFMFNLADLIFSIGFVLILYGIWKTNR